MPLDFIIIQHKEKTNMKRERISWHTSSHLNQVLFECSAWTTIVVCRFACNLLLSFYCLRLYKQIYGQQRESRTRWWTRWLEDRHAVISFVNPNAIKNDHNVMERKKKAIVKQGKREWNHVCVGVLQTKKSKLKKRRNKILVGRRIVINRIFIWNDMTIVAPPHRRPLQRLTKTKTNGNL